MFYLFEYQGPPPLSVVNRMMESLYSPCFSKLNITWSSNLIFENTYLTVLVVITILGCRTTPYAQHSRLPQGQCREPRPDVHTRLCFEADVCVLLGFVSLLARVNNFEYLRGPCCNDVGTWSELICHILRDLDVKLSKNMFCMLLPRVMRSGNLRHYYPNWDSNVFP